VRHGEVRQDGRNKRRRRRRRRRRRIRGIARVAGTVRSEEMYRESEKRRGEDEWDNTDPPF